MSTYTIHPHEKHHLMAEWGLKHPLVATVAAIAVAMLAGALIGVLLSMVTGQPVAEQHRAGGHHARVAVTSATTTVTATVEASRPVAGAGARAERSPARGGFAVGRAEGAGSGFIVIGAGTRAPARGGFAGRSLGAGQVASSVAQGPAVD